MLKGRGDVLLAGTEMTNSITGKPALVSGIISVLMNTHDADAVANQLGLTVERVYPRLDLVLFKPLKALKCWRYVILLRQLRALMELT